MHICSDTKSFSASKYWRRWQNCKKVFIVLVPGDRPLSPLARGGQQETLTNPGGDGVAAVEGESFPGIFGTGCRSEGCVDETGKDQVGCGSSPG